jgi:hypothetical protein
MLTAYRYQMAGRRRDERASLVRTSEWGFFNSSSASRSQMPDRTFPSPWSSEEHSAYFVIRDYNGRALAYVYYETEPRRRSGAKQQLSKDEARRIAASFVKLPELLRKE